MLITQDPIWQVKHWPGPFVRVIGPGKDQAAAAHSDNNKGWVIVEALSPTFGNVGFLQQILVKLWAYRQLGFGPMLYSRDRLPNDEVHALLRRLSDDPNLVELTTDEHSNEILKLSVGANLIENPHFGSFFRNLTHTETMPPDYLADQLRRHLAVAGDQEAQL